VDRRLVTRRALLRAGAAAGVAGALGSRLGGLGASQGRLIESALSGATGGSLADVEHLVILMQENRSFDHYFGTMAGVRNYTDRHPYRSYAGAPTVRAADVVAQSMAGTSIGGTTVRYALADGETTLEPFELQSNPPSVAGQTTNDITHDWGPQHGAWHDGAMDRFMVEHLANDPEAAWQSTTTVGGVPVPTSSTVPTGITAMGYYRRKDCLAFYRALAEAFTLCDGYHCSVLGPTDPNRLMFMSGSLGAHSGDVGGPVLTTYVQNREQLYGTLDWPTVPELLTANEVSWKVYQDPTSQTLFNILTYFKRYMSPSNATEVANAAKGLAPLYPAEFAADVAAGTLPSVSWLIPPAFACEHPASPPEYGEWLVSQVLGTLVSNPEVWAKTVFLVVYDENGGFFDHVPPATPGPTVQLGGTVPSAASSLFSGGRPSDSIATYGTDGEYVDPAHTSNAAGGPPSDWARVLGPVGLGFRTPALVVSPFSAGGNVCSDVFDHVSVIKLIERLFLTPGTVQAGLHVSPWRYQTVGDLTSALPGLGSPSYAVPALPATSLLFPETATQAVVDALSGTVDYAQAYPPPTANSTAWQEPDQA
jgi:phospholipase C